MSPYVRIFAPPSRLSIFRSLDLDRRYLPTRGLPYSLLVHGIAFGALLLLSVLQSPKEPARKDPLIDGANKSLRVIMYLPRISELAPPVGSQSEPAPGPSLPPPVAGRKGASYPGPQRILSEFPEPTSQTQTLIQPALKKLPILEQPVALPNLVLLADASVTVHSTPAEPATPPDLSTPEERQPVPEKPKLEPPPQPETPKPEEPQAPPVEAPKPAAPPPEPLPPPPAAIDSSTLVVPAIEAPPRLPKTNSPLLVSPPPAPKLPEDQKTAPQQPPPAPVEAPKAEQPKPSDQLEAPAQLGPAEAVKADAGAAPSGRQATAGPQPAPALEVSPTPSRGPDVRTVVSLSPTPALNGQPVSIPPAESRGRFAISPEPNPSASKAEPGPSVGGSGTQIVLGTPRGGAPTGNAAAGNPPASVTVNFGAGGTTKGKGSGGDGNGAGPPGARPGPAVRVSTGAGGGKPRAAIAGVRIIGGMNNTGAGAGAASQTQAQAQAQAARPLQTSYGVFVVSTESSGGGLPTFGVFSNEQVYTAYLDMRQSASESAPSWTVEFAVAREATPSAAVDVSPNRGLVLPFPVIKKKPVFPIELVRRHLSKLIIVYAIINVEGKMEQLAVKETPDPNLAAPVVEALSEWVFKPAALEGVSVPVKVLLGIPLWAPE